MSLNLQICTIKMIMTYLYLAGAKSPFENSISTSNLAIILRQWCCFGKIIFIVSVPRALIPENDQRDLGTHVPTSVTRLDDFLKFWMKFFNTSKENNSEPEPDLRFSYLGSGSYLDLKLAKRGRLHKPLTPTGNPWCAFNKKIGTGSGSLPELCLRLFFLMPNFLYNT